MRGFLRLLLACLSVGFIPASLTAQSETTNPVFLGSQANTMLEMQSEQQRHWLISGKVASISGTPIIGAKVTVKPLTIYGETRTFKTDLMGEFRTDYSVGPDFTNVFATTPELKIQVTVEKKSFVKAFAVVDCGSADKPLMAMITLRNQEEDPDVLSQAELVSALAPKLKNLGPTDGLSAKEDKDFARGVDEFLEKGRPEQALSFLGKVVEKDKTCIGCRAMLGLAELNFGDWYGGNRDVTEAAREVRADPAHRRPEPFVVLGVMETWRHQPLQGAGFLQEALKYSPQDSLALQELARTQLLLANWDVASDYFSKALAAGATPEAHLLRAKALLGGGQFDEAGKEMTTYLAGRDIKTMPLPVRMEWSQIQDRKKTEAAYAKASPEMEESIDYLQQKIPELNDLVAAEDQKPLEGILKGVGKNVQEFFRNFPNTSSTEEIHQEQLGRNGKAHKIEQSRYRYLCALPAEAQGPGFDEYRLNVVKDEGSPGGLKEGFMLTAGFASAQIIFHPLYQSQSTFRYLGRQKLADRDTYVVAWAQQPAKAQIHGIFKSGEHELATFSQGLAWIDAQSDQIVRLRSDLLKPLPELKLKKQTTDIAFTQVRFSSSPDFFWLPQQVTVTVDWNGHLLRNEHQYSEYKVFNVDSRQKFGKVSTTGEVSKDPSRP